MGFGKGSLELTTNCNDGTQFQQELGEPATGNLTFGQVDTLFKRIGAVTLTPIYLSSSGGIGKPGPSIFITDGYASVEGTWVIEGDKIAHPLNITSIKCYRNLGHCFQVDIEIDTTDLSGNTAGLGKPSLVLG